MYDGGGYRDFEKMLEGLFAGHHGCLFKKIFGFRWSKKAKITLKTITF